MHLLTYLLTYLYFAVTRGRRQPVRDDFMGLIHKHLMHQQAQIGFTVRSEANSGKRELYGCMLY